MSLLTAIFIILSTWLYNRKLFDYFLSLPFKQFEPYIHFCPDLYLNMHDLCLFLNQVRIGCAPGFLKSLLCIHMYVYVYVCLYVLRLLIIVHVK